MIAPTERHLEDWIVQHAPLALPYSTILQRQLALPSGIADLLVVRKHYLSVVELKKGRIDADCIAQTLRYMGDLFGLYEEVAGRLFSRQLLTRAEFDATYSYLPHVVQGMVIGSGLGDKHLPVICEAARITLMIYTYHDDGSYSFECVAGPSFRSREADYEAFANGDVLSAIKDFIFMAAKTT